MAAGTLHGFMQTHLPFFLFSSTVLSLFCILCHESGIQFVQLIAAPRDHRLRRPLERFELIRDAAKEGGRGGRGTNIIVIALAPIADSRDLALDGAGILASSGVF